MKPPPTRHSGQRRRGRADRIRTCDPLTPSHRQRVPPTAADIRITFNTRDRTPTDNRGPTAMVVKMVVKRPPERQSTETRFHRRDPHP